LKLATTVYIDLSGAMLL